MKLTKYEFDSLQKLEEKIHENKWSNDGLVQLIELCGFYLNVDTIPKYAKKNNLTYNGVKKCRTIKKIFGVKYVIDNE